MSEKKVLTDLALFGGKPLFSEAIHVGRPNIGDRERFFGYVNDIFDRRWLTNNGRYVRELEDNLAKLMGVAHCVMVNNGTTGLMLAIRALNLSGEVIVPSFTFVATVHALQWLGLRPVFCDVDPQTHNLDPGCVADLITPQTSAVLGVHLWGQLCDVEQLAEIAEQHGLKLFYDAAHAFCSKRDGRYSGSFGDLEVFSFHATKFFNTFEGGAITTNNAALASELRLLRNFGFAGEDHVIALGINAKLNEVSAAMGLNLLPELPDLLASARRNYLQYRLELGGIPGLRFLSYADAEANNCQYVVIEVNTEVVDRDLLKRVLHCENILTRRYFHPGTHRMEPYRSQESVGQGNLSVTERLTEQILVLPNNATLSVDDVSKITGILRFVFAQSQELTDRAADREL